MPGAEQARGSRRIANGSNRGREILEHPCQRGFVRHRGEKVECLRVLREREFVLAPAMRNGSEIRKRVMQAAGISSGSLQPERLAEKFLRAEVLSPPRGDQAQRRERVRETGVMFQAATDRRASFRRRRGGREIAGALRE